MSRFITGIIITLALYTTVSVRSYKILSVYPFEGKSHYLIFEDLMKELAHRGHEVTVLSHFPQQTPIKGFRDLAMRANSNIKIRFDFDSFMQLTTPQKMRVIASNGLLSCEHLKSDVVQNLLKCNNETFDVILIEQFNSDCFLGFAWHFDAPYIGITTHVLMPWANDFLGNPDNPAYVPNHFMYFSDRMSFWERMLNSLAYAFTIDLGKRHVNEASRKVAARVFGNGIPELSAIGRNMSLMLSNTHFSLTRPRPLVPSIIEIAGIHLHHMKTNTLPKVNFN